MGYYGVLFELGYCKLLGCRLLWVIVLCIKSVCCGLLWVIMGYYVLCTATKLALERWAPSS